MSLKRSAILLLIFSFASAYAQTPNQLFPYSYSLYQKLDGEVYNSKSRVHSSLKPFFFDDSLLANRTAALLNGRLDSLENRSWARRKLHQEHLFDVRNDEFTVYADFLPDVVVGKDYGNNRNTWVNTRGFQLGGTVGSKFSFYTSGFENQGQFAGYYEDYIKSSWIVPGQSYDRARNKTGNRDWSYVSALLSYTPVKYLNITLGQDKNFIGDGYRSMILSDFASNYPFLKLTGNVGNVQYMALWAQMQDPGSKQLSYDAGNRKKGGVFHYLDWNVNNRLSLGFFDAVIWAATDDQGNPRGFDWTYVNPLIFLRPLEAMNGSPDNALMGLNVKYELFRSTALYGQFLLDEFQAENFFKGNGGNGNKWGIQVGFRGANLFGIENLNYLAELNTSRPYTYTSRSRIISYSQYNEPLAHPFGANFLELVSKLNYSAGRFDFGTQVNLAEYGSDLNRYTHYGKNIFIPYRSGSFNNFIGQGVPTKMRYGEVRVAYILNPSYNLRIEGSGVMRTERSSILNDKTSWVTVGLRSSFRNLYQDLSSY